MSLNHHLDQLNSAENIKLLRGILRGIEKESLRVNQQGYLATSHHPSGLGSALTHPSITTDFSEALLEFITAPSTSVGQLLDELDEIHRFTYQQLDDELLWVSSMPCQLGADTEIPIADYGNSNIGTMKKVYRVGLGHRYGRAMQTIAGIHYNFSVPDDLWRLLQASEDSSQSLQAFKSEGYFGLIRNFRRYSWLLIYLLGAAPAVCKSFVKNRAHRLVAMGSDTHSLHTPYATSLRMGDLGYQSDAQSSLAICYNSLQQYIDSLGDALQQPYAAYDNIGLKDQQGNYRQLNTNLLQIENEFYSTVRPKRTAESGETPLQALNSRGVEYIEVRCLDVNPLVPGGIDRETVHFLDAFLLFCLLSPSPQMDDSECAQIPDNLMRTVYSGRDPQLQLMDIGGERGLRDWGLELINLMQPVAKTLDSAQGEQCTEHRDAVNTMRERLRDPQSTPSARLLTQMQTNRETYYATAMGMAKQQRELFVQRPLDNQRLAHYRELAAASHRQQLAIEGADSKTFDQFLADYWQSSRR